MATLRIALNIACARDIYFHAPFSTVPATARLLLFERPQGGGVSVRAGCLGDRAGATRAPDLTGCRSASRLVPAGEAFYLSV